MVTELKIANFFETDSKMRVRCKLCPHFCILKEEQTGLCGVRKNIGGKLYSSNYGYISGIQIDPIEKKPLYHFYPTSAILSVGSLGCNLFCKFCQNWEIAHPESSMIVRHEYKPEELVAEALKQNDSIGIAFTYNEPTVFYEFMLDTAKLAAKTRLKNVMVSNGYINPKPLEELIPYIDAFNIDLKAFNEDFYKKQTNSKIHPVLESLKQIYLSGKHLEITNLIIPGLNDNELEFRKMMEWIVENLSNRTVLHLSRYFPHYLMSINATPQETLLNLYKIAKEYLAFVYLGNVLLDEGSSTSCPICGEKLIERKYYNIKNINLTEKGHCGNCDEKIVIM